MRFLKLFVPALLLLASPASSARAAGPILQSQKPCVLDEFGSCAYVIVAGVLSSARTVRFDAPSGGQALVSASGSGFCGLGPEGGSPHIVELYTQIVDQPSAVPDYNQPGGNRFDFDGTGEIPFNLASQRLFSIKAAGVQHYALNMIGHFMDTPDNCTVESIALTVLFLPN